SGSTRALAESLRPLATIQMRPAKSSRPKRSQAKRQQRRRHARERIAVSNAIFNQPAGPGIMVQNS
ncbi:MAG: hypothetical protein WBW45_19695, partial [Bradyrhizobium sp.]